MWTTKRVILAMTVGALACATTPTPYQRKDSNGGYADVPLDGRTYVVSFDGNSSTDRERVTGYLQYRCAELTLETGYTHYIVLHVKAGKDDSTRVTNVTGGPFAPSAVTQTLEKPNGSVVIKLFRGPPPPGAFDAAEVLRTLGPRIGQPDRLQARATATAGAAP